MLDLIARPVVFADTPISGVSYWMNDDQSGLYGMRDGCEMLLGKDNYERLVLFPKPTNASDPWHGYPIESMDLGDGSIKFWLE